MPAFDLLLFDPDGTLLAPDHATVSPRNRKALLAAKEAGVRLAVATGRCLKILPPQVMELGFDYAITSNGAAIEDFSAGKQIHYNGPTAREAAIAYAAIRPHADFIEWYANGGILLSRDACALLPQRELPFWHREYFMTQSFPVADSAEQYLAEGAPGLEKISLVRYPREVIARCHCALSETGLFSLTGSIGSGLEIGRRDCTKGTAALFLCGYAGLNVQRAAACGDGNNDADMLRTVGFGVAMGNAVEAARAAARHVTDTNDRDGVAQFIEQYVL